MARNVLITGGGTGIGFAIAERFAAAADNVIITGRRADVVTAAADKIGARALAFDAADPDHWRTALDSLPDSIDVLINNAGGNTDFDTADPTDLAGIRQAWLTNLTANVISAVLATNAVADRLAAGGTVVLLGSIAADKGAGAYGAAKAALASWNVDLARELGARDVTSNVISPGYVGDTEFFRGRLSDQRREVLIGQTAIGRPGMPEDIAGVAYFLASPAARYVSGQVINVNGGAWPTR